MVQVQGSGRGVRVTQSVVGETSMDGKLALLEWMVVMISEEEIQDGFFILVKNRPDMNKTGLIPAYFQVFQIRQHFSCKYY